MTTTRKRTIRTVYKPHNECKPFINPMDKLIRYWTAKGLDKRQAISRINYELELNRIQTI